MGKLFKWTAIGCGGLMAIVIIVIVISALAGGGGSDEPEVNVADDGATGSPSDTAEVPDGKEKTNPLPRGYSIVHNDLRLTILDASYSTSEQGVFTSLEEDHIWATVKLRIEALGDPNDTFTYNTIDFRLVGDRGIIYDDWAFVPDGDMGSGEFFGGSEVETSVIRQIHEDESNVVLIYSPAFKGSRYLALGVDP